MCIFLVDICLYGYLLISFLEFYDISFVLKVDFWII